MYRYERKEDSTQSRERGDTYRRIRSTRHDTMVITLRVLVPIARLRCGHRARLSPEVARRPFGTRPRRLVRLRWVLQSSSASIRGILLLPVPIITRPVVRLQFIPEPCVPIGRRGVGRRRLLWLHVSCPEMHPVRGRGAAEEWGCNTGILAYRVLPATLCAATKEDDNQ